MSFYIRNIQSEEEMNAALSEDKKIVSVRFGRAECPESQRLDQMLRRAQERVSKYFVFYAYEIRDMKDTEKTKYAVDLDVKCALAFFYQGSQCSLVVHDERVRHIQDTIPDKEELISLLVFIKQGIKWGRLPISIPSCYKLERKRELEDDLIAELDAGLGSRDAPSRKPR